MPDAILTRKGGGNPIGSHLIVRKSHDGSEAPVTPPLELEYYQRIIADTQFSTALLEKIGTGEVTTTKAIVDGETLQLTFSDYLAVSSDYKVTIPLNCLKDKLGNSLKGVFSYTFHTTSVQPPRILITTSASITDINYSIANLPSGSVVSFTDGVFLLDSPIIINRSDITLKGVKNKTVIRNNALLGSAGLVQIKGTSGTPISNIVFDGFTVDGNTTASKTGYGVEVSYCGVGFVNTGTAYDSTKVGTSYVNKTGVIISNCVIKATTGFGIYLNYSPNNSLKNNIICNNKGVGVYVSNSSNSNSILNNMVQNNGTHGIFFNANNHNNIIEGNVVQNNISMGIYLSGSSSNVITGNSIQNNGNYGIYLESSCYYNLITSNTSQNNNSHGVCLNLSCNANSLLGNTFQNNVNSGICIYSTSNNNIIMGNTVQNNSGPGITLGASSKYNNISGNISTNNANPDINIDSNSVGNTLTSNQTVLTIMNNGTGNILANNYDS